MTDPVLQVLLPLHAGATLFMTGVIWFVQVVHYPLFAAVGRAEAAEYERAHVRRTTRVVAPVMLAELVTGIALAFAPPPGMSPAVPAAGLALLAVLAVSTQFVQIPCHNRLSRGFDPAVHRRLVRTNWVRTAAWSLRGVLVLVMVGNTPM